MIQIEIENWRRNSYPRVFEIEGKRFHRLFHVVFYLFGCFVTTVLATLEVDSAAEVREVCRRSVYPHIL